MSTKELVAVRLEVSTIARIDALKGYFSSAWHEASRSDILRALILYALPTFEDEAAVAKQEQSAAAQVASGQKAKRSAPKQPQQRKRRTTKTGG